MIVSKCSWLCNIYLLFPSAEDFLRVGIIFIIILIFHIIFFRPHTKTLAGRRLSMAGLTRPALYIRLSTDNTRNGDVWLEFVYDFRGDSLRLVCALSSFPEITISMSGYVYQKKQKTKNNYRLQNHDRRKNPTGKTVITFWFWTLNTKIRRATALR